MSEQTHIKSTAYRPPEPQQGETVDSSQKNQGLARFDLSQWWSSQLTLMMIVFSLLLFVAVLLSIFSAPPALPTRDATDSGTSVPNAQDMSVQGDTDQALPWQRQREAQARLDSQDLLAEMLSIKKGLESMDVLSWAKPEYDAALALAEAGDDSYKLQEYEEALTQYQAALAAMRDLERKAATVVVDLTAQGQQALADGKVTLATDLFTRALAIDGNHIPALTGLSRTESLPKVIQLEASAQALIEEYRANGDPSYLESAVAKLEQARQLDVRGEAIAEKLDFANHLITEHKFTSAMSDALNAMFEQRYSSAQQGFSAALEIKPDDKVARDGLQQALALNRNSSLVSLYNEAKRHENAERWQQAQTVYQELLNRDQSQVRARTALVQAQVRAQLDSELERIKASPLEVTDPSKRQRIEEVLASARALARSGPRLQGQIDAIDNLLKGSEQLITVALSSDGATNVVLRKRGAKAISYEPFQSKQLSLKPGRYVLTGQRLGYQDVRREVVISPQTSQALQVDVRCTVALDGAASE